MEPFIGANNITNHNTANQAKFLQCQRCAAFILSETSTAKRIHNVKCLSSTVTRKGSCGGRGDCDIFQGFLFKYFPVAAVNIPKLTDTAIINAKKALKTRKRIGRPPGGNRSRNEVEVANIIEDTTRRSRKAYLKAKEKFKELEKGITSSEESDNEAKKPFDRLTGKEKRETRGRKPLFETPMTGRERYLMLKHNMSIEQVRAKYGGGGRVESKKGKQKELTPKAKYLRYTKRTTCSFCDEHVRAYFLKMHIAHFHTEGHDKKGCECDVDRCKSIDKQKRERGRSKDLEKASCIKCGKLIQLRGMKEHLALHDNPSNRVNNPFVKTAKCIICDKYFAHASRLKVHFVAVHMENTPFVCKFPRCSFKAGEYYHLERHVGKHLQDNKIKCRFCGKLFTKVDTLYKHREICLVQNGNDSTTEPVEKPVTKRFEESLRVKRFREIDSLSYSKEQEEERLEASSLKRETVIEISNIHLYDKIIETENGPIHIKGERLDPIPETPDKLRNDDPNRNMVEVEDKAVSEQKVEVIESDKEVDDSGKNEEWDEEKIRETVTKLILGWNDKLRDISYLNSLIKQDPVFQKLEKENADFANRILPNGGRRSYFIVHKSKPKSLYRCNNCRRAFRRSWALVKHQEQNVCHLIAPSKNESDMATSTSLPEGTMKNNDGSSSMNLLCTGCGFTTKSAARLAEHLKTSPLHNKKWWSEKKFKCPRRCGAWYRTLKELNDHIDNIHLKVPEIKCDQCSRSYVNKKLLHRHKYYFHSNKPLFDCVKCGKRFFVKENHERHETNCNVEERRPKCQQCNEHFSDEHSLRRHVKIVHLKLQHNMSTDDITTPASSCSTFQNRDSNPNLEVQTEAEVNVTENNKSELMILGV